VYRLEFRPHPSAQKIAKQYVRNRDSDDAFEGASAKKIEQIAGYLGGDENHGEPPSPEASLESGECQSAAE
jgi:hypothetical protein